MEYRQLPGTEYRLSVVGFGCWAIGGQHWGDDAGPDDFRAAIREALAQGINWFDTAPLYGHGRADELLAEVLRQERSDALVVTKVGVRTDGGGHPVSDLRAEHIVADTEASLRRLRLDTIPLLLVHWPCELGTPLDESVAALESLKSSGKISHYGVCNYPAPLLKEVMHLGHPAALETPYSMVRREFEQELRGICMPNDSNGWPRQKLGVIAYETLCRGLLTGKYAPGHLFGSNDMRSRDRRFSGEWGKKNDVFIQSLRPIANKLNISLAALAIGWVCQMPGVTAAVVGAKRPGQVREWVQALGWMGFSDLWAAVDRRIRNHT